MFVFNGKVALLAGGAGCLSIPICHALALVTGQTLNVDGGWTVW